jgi:hypothetical protein
LEQRLEGLRRIKKEAKRKHKGYVMPEEQKIKIGESLRRRHQAMVQSAEKNVAL